MYRLIPDNNSDLVIEGFLKSNSKKKLIIVGDVPYNDNYAGKVKSKSSKKIIFTGYINSQKTLSFLYKNSYAYIHGHEFGGTNPTMINALDINCEILALDTPFNREMLQNKYSIFFKKNQGSVSKSINYFEKNLIDIIKKNRNYELPKKYNWDYITNQYIEVFKELI